ncbi:MAG: tripartite tricarboxylate transporter substrate-binding protein [Rubrivivax sp.]
MLYRRELLAATLLALAAAAAQAQTTKPIKLVVPFGPGTTTDIVSRAVGDELGKAQGQTVVVENRAGAGGTVATAAVAAAEADGTTLVMGTVGTHAINGALYRKISYNALKDFAPVAYIGATPTLLVVASASPVANLRDLRAAMAKSGGVSYASAGNGTSGHLAGALLEARLGGQAVHVPYKEGGQALTEVMAGQPLFMFYHPAAVLPHIKSGKLRALGTSSARRSAAAPDVPTLQEQGVADFDLVAWFMLYAPAATPQPVLAKLREAAAKALANPALKERLAGQGIETQPMNAQQMAEFGTREAAKWAEAVKTSGAQID